MPGDRANGITPIRSLIERLGRRRPRILRDEIQEILACLDGPVSRGEREEGWTDQLKLKWRGWYDEMDRQLEQGHPPDQKLSGARAMELDGVGQTTISNLAMDISRRLANGERY